MRTAKRPRFDPEPAPFSEAVFVCSKCAARLGRGSKGRTELKGEIKRALKARGLGGEVRVIETSCLDVCPKNGQTVATLAGLARGEVAVVGGEADGEGVVKLLFDAVPSVVETLAAGSARPA